MEGPVSNPPEIPRENYTYSCSFIRVGGYKSEPVKGKMPRVKSETGRVLNMKLQGPQQHSIFLISVCGNVQRIFHPARSVSSSVQSLYWNSLHGRDGLSDCPRDWTSFFPRVSWFHVTPNSNCNHRVSLFGAGSPQSKPIPRFAVSPDIISV